VGGRGGRGAESYDRNKVWSSINLSILSAKRGSGVLNMTDTYTKGSYTDTCPMPLPPQESNRKGGDLNHQNLDFSNKFFGLA
jgi:hypothetical protein